MSWCRSGWWWCAALAAVPVWAGMACFWPVRPQWPDARWLMLVLVWPVLEELLFRDGLLRWLARRPTWQQQRLGISAANAAAAVLFAVFHLYAHAPAWAAAVLVPGLLFGYCYERAGLAAAIALHMWYNAGYFTLYPPGV